MPSKLRPAFLVTAALSSTSMIGCKKGTGATDPSAGGSGEVITSTDRDAFHVRETDRAVDWDAYPTAMNARTEEGKEIYRHDQGCYFHGEFDERPTSWVPPPRESVACPPMMRAAAWSFCTGGTLSANPDGSECLCSLDGNPPPPPHLQDCPTP
jgi:hypothetical protein